MESLYAKYLKERTEIEIIEYDYGFATFSIFGEECYIRDIYIVPEERRKNAASTLADEIVEIARARGCTYLTGTVCPTTKGATVSLKVLIGYQMKLHAAKENLIVFKKDII